MYILKIALKQDEYLVLGANERVYVTMSICMYVGAGLMYYVNT